MTTLPSTMTLAALASVAVMFTLFGLASSRLALRSPTDFIAARNTMGTGTTAGTVLATSLGAWILFGPAEIATWGGIAAVTGYAIAAMAPRLALIPLGLRMRRLMPEQIAMTEFVRLRFGRGMYRFALLVMLFFLIITVSAEITGMAILVAVVADIPLWMTAALVLGTTIVYTSSGGLRASIRTDRLQILLILPIIAALVLFAAWRLEGLLPALRLTQEARPELLSFNFRPGIETAISLILGLTATSLFNQGYWQRVFAARDDRALVRGFIIAALAVLPIIMAFGLFGLVAVGLGKTDTPSIALFVVVLDAAPTALAIAIVLMGLALVMSSADTALNAIASILTADLPRAFPRLSAPRLLLSARLSALVVAIPALAIASQGYSVLYLFLLANLFCVAAAPAMIVGMFSPYLRGNVAVASTAIGIVAGLALFPDPNFTRGYLMGSYLLALGMPCLLIIGSRLVRASQAKPFNFATLKTYA